MFNQPSFSEGNAQSNTTDESGIEPSLLIANRTAYGRGTVSTFAHFDPVARVVILEERDRERSTFTPLTTADAVQRLVDFLTMVEKHLPLKQSA